MSYSLKRTKREYTPLPVNDRRFDYVLTEAEARQQYSPINSAGNMVMKLASDVNDMKINIAQLVQKVSLLSSGSGGSGSSGSTQETFTGGTITNPLIIGLTTETNSLVRGLQVLDTNHTTPGDYSEGDRGLVVMARALEGNYGPACKDGDVLITAVGSDFTIQRHSATNNGIRMTQSSVLIGAGGTAINKPTAGLLFSGRTVAVTGDLVLSNSTLFYPILGGNESVPLRYLNNITSSVQNQLDAFVNRVSSIELKCRGFQYSVTSDVLGDTSDLLPIPPSGFNFFDNWVLSSGLFTTQLITSALHTPTANGYASVLLENLTGLTSSVQVQLNTLTSTTKTLNTAVSTLQTDTVASLKTELDALKLKVNNLPTTNTTVTLNSVGSVVAFSMTPSATLTNSVDLTGYGKVLLYGKYIFCDGRLLRQIDFPDLYSAIGSSYTTIDQLSLGNFYLPDFRECFIKGAGTYVTPGAGAKSRGFGTVQPGLVNDFQLQSIQEHTHTVYRKINSGQSVYRFESVTEGAGTSTPHIYKNVTTKNLTQPNCVCLNYYIQAFK
jgi:microcystin-dependent protein